MVEAMNWNIEERRSLFNRMSGCAPRWHGAQSKLWFEVTASHSTWLSKDDSRVAGYGEGGDA